MQRPRQQRYWAGKPPEWVEHSTTDHAAPPTEPAAPLGQTAAGASIAGSQAVDPRLLRLQQRQGQPERRGASEAVVVQRRRLHSPQPDGTEAGQLPHAWVTGGAGPDAPEDEDEEAIAARRMAIRARQLAAAAAAAASASSDGDKGSEDSSEYTSDNDSEEECGLVMLKPAFVPKTNRETLAERAAMLAQAEQTTRQQAEQLEDRRRQTQELVMQTQLQEAQQDVPVLDASDFDTGDEEDDEIAQYESWRERELQRIARDRHLRQMGAKAEGGALAPTSDLAAAPVPPSKKTWKFLQKYWHKGAFFQGEDEEGESILGDVMRRDYDAPTGEDKFDKQMLPKIMQVRNFGRRGRTKWQHLLAEDTTMQTIDTALPGQQPRQQLHSADFSRPRSAKT